MAFHHLDRRAFTCAVAAIGFVFCFCFPAQADFLGFIGIKGSTKDYDEKAGGTMLDQLVTAHDIPDVAYIPPESLMKPYATATLGPDIAYAIVHDTDIVFAPEAQKFCQDIVDQLLEGWPGDKPHVKVLIAGDATYGAFSNESGDIFVNIGTFNQDPTKGLQDKEELALLLGHELTHILLLHIERQQQLKEITHDIGVAASVYLTYTEIKNSHMQGNTLQIAADNDAMVQATVGGLASTMLVGDLFRPSWGRDEEYEADKIGLDLARKAGYAVSEIELRQFVEKHANEQALRSERMKKLQAVSDLLILAAKSKAASGSQAGSLAVLGAKLLGTALLDKAFGGLSGLNVQHPDKDAREAELLKYASEAYGNLSTDASGKIVKKHADEIRKIVAETSLRQTLASAATARQVQDIMLDHGYAEANAANQQTQTQTQSQSQAAVPPIPSACARGGTINVSFPIDSAPFTWRTRGNWESISTGCQTRASDDWSRSARSNYATMEVLNKLAIDYFGTPKASMLPPLYDKYKALIGTDDPFPELAVAAAVVQNDQATAEVRAAQCYAYDNHSLYPACAKILGYDPTAKGVGAKTPQGQKAFASASVSGLFSGSIFQ